MPHAHPPSASTRGFSLVELSIVLVIIGLLVGGTLMGSSLMEAASLRKQIAQIEEFQLAIRTFKDKYRGLPGDLSNATLYFSATEWPGILNGNGNGEVRDSGTASFLFDGEIAQAWMQLSAAKLVNGTYNTSPVVGEGMPELALGGSGAVIAYDTGNIIDNIIYLGVGGVVEAGVDESITGANSFTALQSWKIDTKLDDAAPMIGKVRARSSFDVTNHYNNNPTYFDNVAMLVPENHFGSALMMAAFQWIIPAAHAGGTAVLAPDACVNKDADMSGSANADEILTKATYALETTSPNCQLAVTIPRN